MGLPSNKSLSAEDLKDDKILTKIATEASGMELDEVKKTLFKVKAGDLANNSTENLKGTRDELSKLYAFLIDKEEKDEDVTKFKMEGLKTMIIHRLKQLMPVGCPKCNTVYVNDRQEAPQVTCRRCGIGACPECFTSEERRNKWTYLCRCCDEAVVHMMGEESLAGKGLKAAKKKIPKQQDLQDAIEVVVEVKDHDGGEDDDGDEEELEGTGDPPPKKVSNPVGSQSDQRRREENGQDNGSEKKTPICHHFKKGRCRHGLSGKQSFDGVEKCPFRHPRVCGRLLRNGDRGRGGCRGSQDGCKEFHDVKMCFKSMNTRKCTQNVCKNGYHIKGTVIQKEEKVDDKVGRGRVERQIGPKAKPWVQANPEETERAKDNNVPSFLGQMLLQQQEMMQQIQQQAQQQRNEQMQFQQHMLQMIARMNGATESRPVGQMVQQPLNYRQVV